MADEGMFYIISAQQSKQIDALYEKFDALQEDVAEIKEFLAEARGRWKMLMAVGGFLISLGAVAAAIFDKLTAWLGVLYHR